MKPLPTLSLAAILFAVACTTSAQLALKDAFKPHFLVGAALNESQFSGVDNATTVLIGNHFNALTPENVMKWAGIHPEADQFNFGPADRYVDFGAKHKMFLVGHTLIWHEQTPAWVFEDGKGGLADRGSLLARMSNHIHTVVGRYKGRVKGWDVVNEALNDDGSMRQSKWRQIIGDDYLLKAFEFAHAADPEAELYYNDYSLENDAKRVGAVALVRKLKAAGASITGIGTQMHIKLDWPSTQAVEATITEFGKLGVKVMVTELDLDVLPAATRNQGADISLRAAANTALNPYTNGLPDSVQQQITDRYASLFAIFVKHSDVMARVTFWGVTDGDSWLNDWPVRGRVNYPLLFDRTGEPKPALSAVLNTASKTVSSIR